ncbi:hypothetical protein Pla163_27050 [Planctomycetes bacterium Pla163]|uniref:FHA domain-containing protein n=1 Tax=Rohdeia mirabilis TaxID=2528008 RepID=A0A518D264_9BACT|nr:hypothetical protein Pla163_27050 [Planctomycetes bacterium Pla163]
MPKLIVQDGDQKRAFRLSKGRLTLGSADSNKLVLTSDGVEAEHAVLTIREEAATLDALATVQIDGESAVGMGLALPLGATVRIGGALIALKADDAEPKAAAKATGGSATGGAARGKSGSSRAGASAGGRASARGGAKRGGSSRRSGASARKGRGGDDDEERPSRRGKPQGKPAWMMPLIVVFALVLAGAGISLMSGSGNETTLTLAMNEYDSGQLARARQFIDEVDRAKLPPDRLADYDATLAKIEVQEQQGEVGPKRSKALQWTQKFLANYSDNFLSAEKRALETEKGNEALTHAKMRIWLQRFEEFERDYPDYASAAWRATGSWSDMVDTLLATRDEYTQFADARSAPNEADLEWAMFLYTDASGGKGRRFDKASEELDAFVAAGGSSTTAEMHRTELQRRALLFSNEMIDLANKTYQQGVAQGGTNNRQFLTAVGYLLSVARYSSLPEKANEALDLLQEFPNLDEIVKSYVNAAIGGDEASADKVAYLEGARPIFRQAIEQAREELAAKAAEKAAESDS